MPSTNSKIELDYSEGEPCPFCGKSLAMRKLKNPFASVPFVNLGIEECRCAGAQEARYKAAEAEREKRRAARDEARAEAFNRAGIPARYQGATHPYARKMAAMALTGQGFYIHGPNGTGKTTLAMAAARLLVDSDCGVFVVATYDLMDAMRSRRDEDRALFDRAASCDVLILDDLGKEASNTAYACERLFAIIDKRDKATLPTIVTSNYNLDKISKRITEGAVGVAIASRLNGSCIGVPLDGEDMRING